ncbi:MAG TPA: TIGR03618 family F420-dependent PPOX class oxidoreductase [Thermoleophilaceae bacterium]|nr:TIGR03618 family F420-dependent PPOX class oxidoreductase [Thermoleophilaceae bacterium]
MASRRDQIRMTDGELRAFLDEQRIVQVATVGPKGRPHLVPLWYFVEDGGDDPVLRGWTYAASQKAKNLARDPRATISIDDGVQYQELRGAMMECDVEVTHEPDGVADYGVALFERYGPGGELAPEVREMVLKQAQKRVGLRFVPTRVVTWDHRKLGGTY